MDPDVDETPPESIHPWQAACFLALKKAQAAALKANERDYVIAADTIVVFDGNTLGKPSDETEAFQMLNMLSGMWHQVITGVVVVRGDTRLVEYETTSVKFREISSDEIEAYIQTGEPMDKAGAYGIQDRGSLFVERIEGDFYNVMGLPLFKLGNMLKEAGLDLLTGCDPA